MASRSITTCDFCEQEIKDDDIVEIHSPLGGCLEDACKACANYLSEDYDRFRKDKGCLSNSSWEGRFITAEECQKAIESSGKDYEKRLAVYIMALRAVATGDVFFQDGSDSEKWAKRVLHDGGVEQDTVRRRNGLAWVRPSSELLRTEIDFFASQVPLWSKIYGGKWALVKAEGPAFALAFSVWDTVEAAYADGVKRYGNVPMLIEQIPKAEE